MIMVLVVEVQIVEVQIVEVKIAPNKISQKLLSMIAKKAYNIVKEIEHFGNSKIDAVTKKTRYTITWKDTD